MAVRAKETVRFGMVWFVRFEHCWEEKVVLSEVAATSDVDRHQ